MKCVNCKREFDINEDTVCPYCGVDNALYPEFSEEQKRRKKEEEKRKKEEEKRKKEEEKRKKEEEKQKKAEEKRKKAEEKRKIADEKQKIAEKEKKPEKITNNLSDKGKTDSKSNSDNSKFLTIGLGIAAALTVILVGKNIMNTVGSGQNGVSQLTSGGSGSAANSSGTGKNNGSSGTAGSDTGSLLSDYALYCDDVGWTEAAIRCQEKGGHLATINSEAEFNAICDLVKNLGLEYVWIGANLENCQNWGDGGCLVTGEDWDYVNWYSGEPSYGTNSAGYSENYLCLRVDSGGNWYMSDVCENLLWTDSSLVGKIGYILETDDGYSDNHTYSIPVFVSGDFVIPDSNTRYITEEELDKLTKEEVAIARNEIFARHGRKFEKPFYKEYFASKDWYHGTIEASDFDKNYGGVLNKYETANASLIKAYEVEKGYR